jgi:maltooligosyltrehalose trehalohydrolase
VSHPTLNAVRHLPVGVETAPGGGAHFRVWAPRRRQVEVVFEGAVPGRRSVALASEPEGYFSGFVAEAGAGDLYRLRLDGGERYPDPASRFQPQGPHGPSQVVDPRAYRWRDTGWRGVELPGQVLYEMHTGTFTPEGTFAAAARELEELAELGVTVLELMPIADFPGRFGWGYDGVNLFAPSRLYGEPEDLRRFVDRAHAVGLGVILDVVYNHFGPDGNYLGQFSAGYTTDLHANDWGSAIGFYGPGSGPVRELFIANAGYWIEEFHFDGLRFDATQDIHDLSDEHILAGLARRARQAGAALPPGRSVLLIAENELQDSRLVRPPSSGGYGLDALWNDDFHHSAHVASTGRREAYYTDYRGTPQELLSAAKHGFLYQGQRYAWQRKPRGRPALDLPPAAFVNYLDNHDQVANSAHGARFDRLGDPGVVRALTVLLLLAPGTPLLFQGQEFCASSPFAYFADHGVELAAQVRKGRREFLAQFPSLAGEAALAGIPDPASPETFARCKLDRAERRRHAPAYALHRALLRLRRRDPVFGAQRARGVDGAVLGDEAFVLRFFGADPAGGDDRLVLVNLGRDQELVPAPEPLLAAPPGRRWQTLLSTDDPRYGGSGAVAPESAEGCWRLAGRAASVLVPAPAPAGSPATRAQAGGRSGEPRGGRSGGADRPGGGAEGGA